MRKHNNTNTATCDAENKRQGALPVEVFAEENVGRDNL